jgi:uncharacterized membrane protein
MHVIPQSWSHLHILVSVFPSFGLVFVLGFYIAGFRADNDGIRRTCLALFGILALLSVPIYLSGDGAMAMLAKNPRFSKEMMNTHYGWGMPALLVLVMTGIVAWVELWRSHRARRASNDPFHLVSGLAIIALGLTAVAGELGLEMNHRELQSATVIPDVSTSPIWPHVHLILNHVPTVGFVFALVFYVTALFANNDPMKRGSLILFVICSIAGVPTYVTGTAAMWALTQPPIPEISKAVINAHRDMALWTLFGLAFTGAAAWIELWRYRHLGRFSKLSLYLVLVFALITLAIMAETGHRGGQINHPEIRLPTDILPTDDKAGWTPAIELLINNVIWFVPWQTVHFFGFSLIFGTVLFVVARILGFAKSIPFSAVHRVLPLGLFGVLMNVFSGMLMMLADSFRYLNETTFAPKIAFVAIGAIAVLYFSLSERVWNVKAGEEAPTSAKAVAVLVLVAWAGVILGGRLLPYV